MSPKSPSDCVIRPVVRDRFGWVLEVDADDDDGDSKERPRGHWQDDQDSHQDNSIHEQAREPRTSLE